MINTAITDILEGMRSNPVHNYIAPGLDSYLLGRENSKVRMFCMTRDQQFYVSPHSHRFDFFSIVVKGEAHQDLYLPAATWNEYGLYEIQEYIPAKQFTSDFKTIVHGREYFTRERKIYYEGESYHMTSDQFHSIEFTKGSIVLFFEGPMKSQTSYFLEPVINGKTIPLFTVSEWMYHE